MRFTPSTIAERSPAWSPWESHPNDDRRTVSHVLCAGGVAATTSAGLGVALAKAVISASNACAESGKVPGQEVVPAQCDLPGTVADNLHGGVSDG